MSRGVFGGSDVLPRAGRVRHELQLLPASGLLRLKLEVDGITWAVGMAAWALIGLKDKVLELEWSSMLSEQDMPIPVSPLSEGVLRRLPRLLLLEEKEAACHVDSAPGNHPGKCTSASVS